MVWPDLKTTKAKVSWKDICYPKEEGGLGMRSLKELNKIYGLKLIWRLMAETSLWVRWVQCYLIRQGSFWSIKESTSSGSWVWRKLLKLRGLAKEFLKKEVRNGECTSFWYDRWSRFNTLKDVLGERGPLDLGVPDYYSVAEAKRNRRRRNHRVELLNQIEEELSKYGSYPDEDVALWKQAEGKFMAKFSTRKTWEQVREKRPNCAWYRRVWFPQSTPKYAFFMWVALKERLQTTDRMQKWNSSINTTCVLCTDALESCDHLFFGCRYSGTVWRNLVEGLMCDQFTMVWNELIDIVSKSWVTPIKTFIIRYTLQATMHTVWWERNARRPGDAPRDINILTKMVDKSVRLRLLSLKGRGDYFEEGLITWFEGQLNSKEKYRRRVFISFPFLVKRIKDALDVILFLIE